MIQMAAAMSRLGTESAFDVLARATKLQQAGKSIINLGIGQPDFPTPANIIEAGVKALRDGQHGYTPANGILPLREAVAADISLRRQVAVDPDQIVIVPGGKVTMAFAIMMFGEAGTEIIYPDPGFPIYRSMIEYSGAKPVPMALYEDRGFGFSAAEVLAQITPATRLIILNSPANPTGGVVPSDELTKLARGLEQHPHVAILSDEIYARMCYDGVPHTSMLAFPALRDRVILLDGWSKTYAMTGWRIGYGVWPKSLQDSAQRLAININSCVNAATQFAAIEALTGPQDTVDAMVAAFNQRRGQIVGLINDLPGMSCVMPGGAFYAFANITGTGMSARALQDALLDEAGVATISGTSFGAQGEGYLRFSYAASNEQIAAALQRIGTFLQTR